jgi:hypothetical protein
LRALRKLIVQAHPDGRQAKGVVDPNGALRACWWILCTVPRLMDTPSTSCMNSTTPRIEA